MNYRIYVDESGTHSDEWLIIGMLFVPDHGALHRALCKQKEQLGYFNTSPKKSARYRETHFTKFRNSKDAEIGKLWIDEFVKHACFFRSIVIDWSIYDGRFFGGPFEAAALKKRRAYKKWAELLLQPELSNPTGGAQIRNAELYLDRLRIMYGYDVIGHLKERFVGNYAGNAPYIAKFQHTDSSKDANQCLQLCDLLTGCLYQELKPSAKSAKLEVRDYLKEKLIQFGVTDFRPQFWRGYSEKSIRRHLPKYSAWFWRPKEKRGARRKKHRHVRGK